MKKWLPLLALAGCADAQPTPPPLVLDGTLPPRPASASCLFEGQPAGVLPEIALDPIDGTAVFDDPVAMAPAPDGSGDVLVLERSGRIWHATDPDAGTFDAAIVHEPAVSIAEALALDTSPQHPDQLFVVWRTTGDVVRLSRLTLTSTVDPASERVVLSSSRTSRAALGFSPDGLLVAAFGDSELEPESSHDASNPATLEGSVVRIDVSTLDATGTFAIPPDNPSFGSGATATWATGVRLPVACVWGPSHPWCADLGIDVSEIHGVPAGRDLGWPTFDGVDCLAPGGCDLELDRFPQALVARNDECGIVGAQIYRGERSPSLANTLLYADRCAGEIHAMLLASPDEHLWSGPLAGAEGTLGGIGRDAHGEIYALLAEAPHLRRIRARNEGKAFPRELSATGCFSDLRSLTPAPGVVPYEVNAPLWSDGSVKQRFLQIPPGTTIEVEADGRWRFPIGTVLVKVFRYALAGASEPVPVETRFMILRAHGWEFHSYRWRDDGTDALLLDDVDERDMELTDGALTHTFPSRSSCSTCHRVDPARVLGVRTDQLNGIAPYADGQNNQLVAMAAIGMFADAAKMSDPSGWPRMPNPYDETLPAEGRARAYLHSNCGHCHQPGGWVPEVVDMDLRFETPFAETRLCDVPTVSGAFGVRLSPGDPEGSRLLERMTRRDAFQMPPLATERVDPGGVAAVRAWIASLSGCPEE